MPCLRGPRLPLPVGCGSHPPGRGGSAATELLRRTARSPSTRELTETLQADRIVDATLVDICSTFDPNAPHPLQHSDRQGDDRLPVRRGQLYAMERFLHRLSRTRHADRFVLKGALLMRAWETSLFRTTRDIDLLARSRPKAASRPAHRGLPCVQRRREIPPCDGIPIRCFRQEYSAP
jgi:hypothetical protein